MKKIFIVIIIVFSMLAMYGQNYSLNGGYRFSVYSGLARIDITEKGLIYVPLKDDKENISDNFKITHISQMPFIQLSNTIPKEFTEDYLYNGIKDLVTDNKLLFLSGKSKILDVLDTPHPQTVDISFLAEPEDIRVEIADVYKGTKYDDTCLHYCITFDEEVVPYENSIGE